MMRDDPSDLPIPEKFKPSPYYSEALEKAKKEHEKLKDTSEAKRIAFGEAEKRKSIKEYIRYQKNMDAENNRLEEMETQVRAWIPPTEGHKGLKSFMLQQINVSKSSHSYVDEIKKAEKRSAMSYYVEAISKATKDIAYYTKEYEKEVERVNDRNEWVRQLRKSIGQKSH